MIIVREELSLDNIRKRIDDRTIMSYIFPTFTRLRSKFIIRDEKSPSASIIQGQTDLLIRDFGDPFQSKAESWYEYIARTKFNNSIKNALIWANNEFNLGLGMYNNSSFNFINSIPQPGEVITRERTIIKIKAREFNERDKRFWLSYGISLERVMSKKIVPLSYFWINNEIYNVKGKLVYAYPLGYDEGLAVYKIYNPYGKLKWITNSVKLIQNYNFIDKSGTHLIVQSSYKDIMCMEELGYRNIIAPSSENTWFTDKQWESIKSNWTNIIYFANNDWDKIPNPGLVYANNYKTKFNIDYVHTPNGASDISDFTKLNGKYKAKKLLKNLLYDFYTGKCSFFKE